MIADSELSLKYEFRLLEDPAKEDEAESLRGRAVREYGAYRGPPASDVFDPVLIIIGGAGGSGGSS